MPDVDIEIRVEWQYVGNDLFDVDGWMLTVDDEELCAAWLIHIVAKLPSDLVVAKRSIKSLRQELISVMIHEIRHAVQRNLWGWKNLNAETLDEHMRAESETDARVEEICSYSSKKINEISQDEFESLALKYIKRYLLRNAKELSINDFSDLCRMLLETHTAHFLKRQQVSEFTDPR